MNQIPCEFTVEIANRFKGPDLDNSVPEELWTEVIILYRRKQAKPSQRGKKKSKKAKWLSEEALQIAEERREEKEKSKDIPILMQSSKE